MNEIAIDISVSPVSTVFLISSTTNPDGLYLGNILKKQDKFGAELVEIYANPYSFGMPVNPYKLKVDILLQPWILNEQGFIY